METITLDQALDVLQATLSSFKKECALTYLYSSYALFNSLWKSRMVIEGGDKVERPITLDDEGNAKHQGNWEQDTHNVINTDQMITANWKRASSNFSINLIEMSYNRGAARIYDKIQNKHNNTIREIIDHVYAAALAVPNSSSDALNPEGVPGWLVQGTDDSTGDWTGYNGTYADGSARSGGVGGITCSATSRPRWANYYADHNGDLDDSLLVILDRATRKLHFEAPIYPKNPGGNEVSDKFSLYSNDNVIGNLNHLYAKSDDQMGVRISQHYGIPHFKGMPFQYVDILDTAQTNYYGTDPIFGVNHELFYPVVQTGWDFRIGKPRARDAQHVVLTTDIDLVYTYIMERRKNAGFLLNQQ